MMGSVVFRLCLMTALALPACAGAAVVAEASAVAEPGLEYGAAAELPLPKTILFSAGPEAIAKDAEEWARHGVNAFFMDFVAREWSSDIWARDGKPWTIGASDETFQQAAAANEVCRRIGSETFLKVSFDHCFEWFNDIAWQQANHNFRQFALFARESGCHGMALDIEYVGEQYDFDWEGYDYDGYTRADLVAKIRERMTRVIQILYDEFPDMTFLTFPEQGLGIGAHIHAVWIEEAARRNAPGGVHYCTEYTYRNPNIRYMFGHGWVCNSVFERILSKRAWQYWQEHCSIAAGVWPFGFNYQSVYDPGMPLEEFKQAWAASLMMSPRYNWIYSHNCREQLIGRDLDKYDGDADLNAYLDVIAKKELVTTPEYVALAKELRALQQRDYSAGLGLLPFVSFAGPEDVPRAMLAPADSCDPSVLAPAWEAALSYFLGSGIVLNTVFPTQPDWMLIGPFPNPGDFEGHHAVYPPEELIDLSGAYEGVSGPVRWIEHHRDDAKLSVNLKKVYEPTEHVCAYGLCYVTSAEEREVQLRIGTNDSGKLWLGGKLVYDYPREGTALLDRDIVTATLPKGTTPILVKACNGELNWGFVFRITGTSGRPIEDLSFSLSPPREETPTGE